MTRYSVNVTFLPVGTHVEVKKGATILEAAEQGGVRLRNVCGGIRRCGKCRVIVEEGEVLEEPDLQRKYLTQDEIEKGYHLACRTRIIGDLRVIIPVESRIEGQRILSEAVLPRIDLNPSSAKVFLNQDILRIHGSKPEDICRLLAEKFSVDTHLSADAKRNMDELNGRIDDGATVSLCKLGAVSEIIDLEPGNNSNKFFGLAVDVGTTKVVIYLANLETGEIVDTSSGYNEQLAYGEDLLSRIDYAHRHPNGLTKLREAVVKTIQNTLKPLLVKNAIDCRHVVDVCISGNTVMTYLLEGLDPSNLVNMDARISRTPIHRRSKELGFSTNPMACVYFLPNVSRFLGGDAVADVLSCGLHESEVISVLIDMGTNSEIVIGSKGWLLSTSCAAGPAFEGWEVRHGMRSVEGAIEHVEIDRETLRAFYTVIGSSSQRPRGLCGSGIVDVVAEMFSSGIIDFSGKIQEREENRLIKIDGRESEYVVASAEETDIGKDIVITQRDIMNLLDSKAAICGATAVLMRRISADVSDIKKLYLAGALGTYVDSGKATQLGIFPEFPNAQIVRIGNGAVAGAYLALLSHKKRREAEQIAETMTYYDLTVDPDFMDEYSAALYIPGRKELFPTLAK